MTAAASRISAEVQHHTVVIVGAGQAGLALSWHLTRRRIDHVLLERETIAHEWRDGRWDNFTLVTPNWQCVLPGWEYAGPDPDGFMVRNEVHRFVVDYARSFDAPVLEHVSVESLAENAEGGFLLETTGGTFSADQVVIAVGGYHDPIIPTLAHALPPTIEQLHSSEYRGSEQLPEGAVLVVGSGQSGAQIAEDLHLAGRQVHLALGSAPRVARFYRGRDCVAWLHDMGLYDVGITQHTGGLSKRESTNHYVTGRDGGRDIDLRRFALEGMRLHGRITGSAGSTMSIAPTLAASLDGADRVAESIKDDIDAYIAREGISAPEESRYVPVWEPDPDTAGAPTTLDLEQEGIRSVVWCIGYRADFRWVRVGVFDGQGHPTHARGVSPVAGLYFLGLPWLHTWGSGRFAGIARDAAHLADRVEEAVASRAELDADRAPSLVRRAR